MLAMSVNHTPEGPPLPKRTSSQRQPRVTANHASLNQGWSHSPETPPPLPPHHPEPRTLPRRTTRSESDAPDLPTRTQSSNVHGIQRRTVETKSFIERNTAKIFSDPTKYESKSMRIRRSHDHETSRALPELPGQHQDRPLPPPPDEDTLSSQKRPPLSHQASRQGRSLPPAPEEPIASPPPLSQIHHNHVSERPLPPPPSTIPTGRRKSTQENVSKSDPPLPPPPGPQFFQTTNRIPAVIEFSDSPPPPPPSRKPTIEQRSSSPTDVPPPLPPSRPKTVHNSKHSANIYDYEKRFVFHDESEFPDPEVFQNKKKEYPSQVMNKRKETRKNSSLGAL